MTVSRPEGITHPSIDELLDKTESKYSLVLYAAKRARQINAYFTPNEGMLQFVGPLVDAHPQEKSLSIALREINEEKVRAVPASEVLAAAENAVENEYRAEEEFTLDAVADFPEQSAVIAEEVLGEGGPEEQS